MNVIRGIEGSRGSEGSVGCEGERDDCVGGGDGCKKKGVNCFC